MRCNMSYCGLRRLLLLAVILGLQCSLFSLHAQITIGGNVYGGGNEGDVKGNTTVTVRAGDIGVRADADAPANKNAAGKVFGGARMANVGGNAYVHIDGANATGDIIINQVFGGNDISGVVGADEEAVPRLPSELEDNTKGVNGTWNSFVRTTASGITDNKNNFDIFIGQLFGGGNGNYEYEDVKTDADGTPNESGAYITHNIYRKPRQHGDSPIAFKTTPAGESGFNIPDLDRSFIDLHGGTISDAYGGGNNATVNEKAVICVDNPSMVVTQINDASGNHLLTEARYREMGVWNSLSDFSSPEFQIGALFGGNNQATMAIRPTWHLQKGQIRNLYSGGNHGDMIYETGLFLEIPSTAKELKVDNLFGGCRMADVRPMAKNALGEYEDVTRVANDIPGYAFPANFAARVIVAGGDVNNVYGGNDVRGKVYFGNAVGIQASIRGDVYGGGNGNYPYTDNTDAMDNEEFSEEYGDYYYDPGSSSIDSLNAIRPNAEQVSIQVRGTAGNPTIIGGAIYVGGNCATLKADPENHGYLPKYPITELKIGSYVIADNVFLGNNGAGLVDKKNLEYYANKHVAAYSGLGLKDNRNIFAKYMLGVALSQVPELKVESTDNGDRVNYEPYTSYIGSLYYGGNRGSMTFSGPINITPNAPIYIYDKLVAGCNNANVAAGDDNAAFEGGIMGDETEQRDGYTGDRVTMTLSKIKMVPMRLNSDRNGLEWNTFFKADYEAVESGTTLTEGETYYTSIKGAGEFIAVGTEEADGTNYFVKTDGYVKTNTGSGEDVDATQDDVDRRLRGANVYGGCCESGHVNGNVVININGGLHERDKIFATINRKEGDTDEILYDYELKDYHINKRNSGVILNEQGMDVLGEALNVFGGGKGKATEIWGSTTVNVNAGYTFQVFGGSESGVIGKSREDRKETVQSTDLLFSGTGKHYAYDPAYSTTVNLTYADGEGEVRNPSNTSDRMADVEFLYGGSFEGPICGNTRANLGNGRLFNLFTGSCNADILGHTETYVGKWTDAKGKEVTGFPYLRDHIYGGNDLGGEIKGVGTFTSRVNDGTLPLVHDKDEDDGTGTATIGDGEKDVLQASSYMEYRQGRMKDIFGGCFGDYDYDGEFKKYKHPHLNNAFVNFRPDKNARNHVDKVFGAGEGYLGDREGDKAQDRSYVLIDIAGDQAEFAETEVFGSGMNNGLGTRYGRADVVKPGFNGDKASAIIDLAHGMFGAAYGGSYNEGVTGRTVVRVPEGSTINIMNIFGGAYGTNPLPPCDVYASNVEYSSNEAVVRGGGIYGGNNNVRRTIYTKVDINSPVYANTDKSSLATVYGAGYGEQTWAEYTLVNLNDGAQVREVYGGGQDGLVLNAESIRDYMKMYSSDNVHTVAELPPHIKALFVDKYGSSIEAWGPAWHDAWRLGDYYNPTENTDFDLYPNQELTNLTNRLLTRTAEMDDRDFSGLTNEQKAKIEKKYNTNVIINKGASVLRYAYGGGLGSADKPNSGDVMGTTYIALLGGTVGADIYAAGTTGSVYNLYGSTDFTASANAYIKGGTVRNVYGGGWRGSVGNHTKLKDGNIVNAAVSDSYSSDIYGETHVVIGTVSGTAYDDGVPSITRNVYGGGEGGAIYGTAYIKMNNGYIGYRYNSALADDAATAYIDERYVAELDDAAPGDKLLERGGNIFGGGYVANSYVDHTDVKMYGGTVRGSLHGGGEIGPVGRGSMLSTAPSTGITNQGAQIYKAGSTHVQLYDGWVKRNVFGGGRGYDNWGGEGYMTEEEKLTMDRSAKGYVFGQTEVDIYGGEVGTDEGVAQGFGNVFGGGDVGFIYSAYEKDGTLCIGKKPDGSKRYDESDEGYYYKWEKNGDDPYDYKLNGSEKILTEDCKVLVEPWCKAVETITLNSKTFNAGDYVPTSYLNYLGNKNDANWEKLSKTDVNKDGIIIHNAVFAGGNTLSGSSIVTANTTTVFGNATASIHDVYHRDLITVGTGHTGGLYGDGNLTLIDGYRELNITNYGTDYYSISPEISLEIYKALPIREAAYYELRYKCVQQCTDKNGKTYGVGSTITQDELSTVFEGVTVGTPPVSMLDENEKPLKAYWIENGVCSRYAGRIMNTIQRADFCGVYGSRMVMQGAQDRVVEVVDYTNYTINRVREVSLNKKESLRSEDDGDARSKQHGNYFGIYNIVNYLGALTSDVDFNDVRVTENDDASTYKCTAGDGGPAYTTATYYDWKSAFHADRRRNNGSSYNKLALASGVYLELTTENGTGTGLYEKDWGYITGIVELDLINVQPGMGGGFVYAKNVHGVRSTTDKTQTTLTELNRGAVTRKKYSYATEDANKKEWQTSGNFIHSTQTIIDDCYNIGNRYIGSVTTDGKGAMPAHYWFIKGSIYVYDQYISAYTGSPNAFSEMVNIPLTITSASHGKLTLIDVMPNRYAYYSVKTGSTVKKLGDSGESNEIVLRDVTYKLNDPISYWDWQMLTAAERELFVSKTYVTTDSCKMRDGTVLPKGYVMLPEDYTAWSAKTTAHVYEEGGESIASVVIMTKNALGNEEEEKDLNGNTVYKAFDDVFHESNNLSHGTGYILTYSVDNPDLWNTWYTKQNDATHEKNQTGGSGYEDGPTYTPSTSGLYGQVDYKEGNIIAENVVTTYTKGYTAMPDEDKAALPKQAKFEKAYIVTAPVLETTNDAGTPQRFYKDATLAYSDHVINWSSISGSVAEAYVVTKTIQLSTTEFIYMNTKMTEATKNKYKTDYPDLADDIDKLIVPAYYCTEGGKYGGNYFQTGHNYRAIESFSSLSDTDRNNLNFNYDALDLLIDPTFGRPEAQKYQYDGLVSDKNNDNVINEDDVDNPAHYSLKTPIDYQATYTGGTPLTYTYNNSEKTLTKGTEGATIGREEFESLLNECYYYSPISVSKNPDNSIPTYYVVKETIVLGDTPYAAGQVIDETTYEGLNDTEKAKVAVLNFTTTGTYYYCREGYTIDATVGATVTNASGVTVKNSLGENVTKTGTYNKTTNRNVPAGLVISDSSADGYKGLTNNQKNFTIHGLSPTETSTLYVVRNSDIKDLTAEKIITVIYQYDYVETGQDGMNITPVSERHVLNIHINFKSGVPTVEDILPPDIVLPGTSISIKEPYVEPGAYEVTGGGWELFDDATDAESHTNGIGYTPNSDPLFLYQNNYLVAYYAQTYLGKTYSNAVPVHVANYHDLKKVMADLEHHYYIDHENVHNVQKVEPKIYINDYSRDIEGSISGLELLKDLFDLSLLTNASADVTDGVVTATGNLKDHAIMNPRVKGANNLEFFMRADLSNNDNPAIDDEWTPIANGSQCFEGTLHGDGHTISGLDNSLFGKLCGDVYNLGVTGSFNGAGIVDEGKGYVENCWINTTGTPDGNVYAVFGNPNDANTEAKQVVNSYYQSTKTYKTTASSHGVATAKPDAAFYNGEVAYNLNGFYLYKRYNDVRTKSGDENQQYQFYTVKSDNTLQLEPIKYYTSSPDLCSSGYLPDGAASSYVVPMYVEDRFADGDFIYDGGDKGVIPTTANERLDAVSGQYFPIWPDDYLFFGQTLNYGYVDGQPHQATPSAINRSDGRVVKDSEGNRVYRAPAYFRSGEMKTAYFNPYAIFAQSKNGDASTIAYKGMTAIDFTDAKFGSYNTYKTYEKGVTTGDDLPDRFYQPLLDDDGLTNFRNVDLTQNLLVYTDAPGSNTTASEKTGTVVSGYLLDPAYSEITEDGKGVYRRVAYQTPAGIHGHWVQKLGSGYTALRDHLLVDKQDFNAPISYQFDTYKRMWYQRYPEDNEFVDRTKGWQAISLPFSAELVTTQQKGEITHFYDRSEDSKNGTRTKIGHEYWLREFKGGALTEKETGIYSANFGYPVSTGSEAHKTFTNSFLWDYYYNATGGHNHKDKNADDYQTYYMPDGSGVVNTYYYYRQLGKGTPYILGLPGVTYYEFDLSGNFNAGTTAVPNPLQLNKQYITFASNPGEVIQVSDMEMGGVQSDQTGGDYYTFKPTYLNNPDIPVGKTVYQLDTDGDSFDKKAPESVAITAFRPYFVSSTSSTRTTRGGADLIVFSMENNSEIGIQDQNETSEEELNGHLKVSAEKHKIIVSSTCRNPVGVRIVGLTGIVYNAFTIQPGETIETRVNNFGVYIVETFNGKYTKKITVK